MSMRMDKVQEDHLPRPQQVDGLLVFVREPERVVVPSEFEPLDLQAMLGDSVDEVVNVDLDGHAVGRAEDEDTGRLQLLQAGVPQCVGHVGHAGKCQTCVVVIRKRFVNLTRMAKCAEKVTKLTMELRPVGVQEDLQHFFR